MFFVRQLRRRFLIEALESRITLDGHGMGDDACVIDSTGANESARAAQAINCFAYDMYQHFQSQPGNPNFSPTSIATAFAIAYAGAAGQTATEIADVFHLGSEPGIHESFRALMTSLERPRPGNPSFELDVSNASWPAIDLTLLNEFTATVEGDYGGQTQNIDYSNTEEARRIINTAVAQQTRGRITNLFETLDPATVMVLTNSIFFKAEWDVQFAPENTSLSAFVRDDGEVVNVPMMYAPSTSTNPLTGAFLDVKYTEIDGFQTLEMPFKNRSSSIVILMPVDENGSNELTPSILGQVDDWLETPRPATSCVNVTIPKFVTTVKTELTTLLNGMGMPTAFGARADFSRMVDGGGIWIGEAPHKANIEINEQGVEAAAATGITFILCFAKGTPVQTPDGDVPIERLRVGDLVMSRNEHNVEGRIQPKRIEEIFHGRAEIVELHVGDQVIRVTKEHRFFVEHEGWMPVAEMVPGNRIATDLSSWKRVDNIVESGEIVPVHNFRVADYHTYFVGSEEWGFAAWTHNCYEGNREFRADRPFHYLIRDNDTSALLFMGRVSDPTQPENDVTPTAPPDDRVAGDSDGDGLFTSSDLVRVFQAGKYENGPASFSEGDWNGDGVFDSSDLVYAFQNSNFEQAAIARAATVDIVDSLFALDNDEQRKRIKTSKLDVSLTLDNEFLIDQQ